MGELSDPKLIRKELKGREKGWGIKDKTAVGATEGKNKGLKNGATMKSEILEAEKNEN